MQITPGDLDDPRIVTLLGVHVARATAETGRGSAHALDLNGLKSPDISFWAAWEGETLAAVGALKRLDDTHGEVKSMHTAQALRGRGAGSDMLAHLIATARANDWTRLSLETGSWPYFAPARALYARHGFQPCGPFGDYVADPNSVFMTLAL